MKPVIPALCLLLAACLLSPPVFADEEELPKSLLIVPWQPPHDAPAIEPPWRHRQRDTGATAGLIEAGVLQRRLLYHRRLIETPAGQNARRTTRTQEER